MPREIFLRKYQLNSVKLAKLSIFGACFAAVLVAAPPGPGSGRGVAAAADPAVAAPPTEAGPAGPRIGRSSGLPLPRYASLKSGKARLRRGPGRSYPIDWEITRRGLPVRVIGEYGHWRRLELHDGSRGWMHKVLLRNAPTALLMGDERLLREEPHPAAPPTARVGETTPLALKGCRGDWCAVEARAIVGWAPRARLWGAPPPP